MQHRKWDQLSPSTRRVVATTGIIDVALRIVALIDLARRPPSGVKGSKRGWAVALAVISSGGILPMVYLILGRRRYGNPASRAN